MGIAEFIIGRAFARPVGETRRGRPEHDGYCFLLPPSLCELRRTRSLCELRRTRTNEVRSWRKSGLCNRQNLLPKIDPNRALSLISF